MKTLFTLLTAIILFTLTSRAQNIPWSADYQGGECTLSMPEWDGYIGNSSSDDGFIHTVNLNDGENGYDGTVTPHQAKVVRVLMAPGVETIMVYGTWSHTYSGVTLHGFFPGEINQVGGFTPDFEPGQVCESGCTESFIDPTSELYLYSSFLDDQKQITRAELGIPIDQPIWVSYVMYQDHDSYTNTNVSLTFSCNVIGTENVEVYRTWLAERPWYTTPGTGSYDGIPEFFDGSSCSEVLTVGSIEGTQTICDGEAPDTFTSSEDATGNDDLTYQWQYSTDGVTWVNFDETLNPHNATLDLLAYDYGVTSTTNFFVRRVVSDCSNELNSNLIILTVENCTGIKNIDAAKTFTIYPNPASNNVQLTINTVQLNIKPIEIQMLDITGKVVISSTLRGTTQSIDISNINEGVYFIKIGDTVKKLIIQ